jgi:DNA-directed RNA polymerase specialized sigma24 family protein
MLLLAYYGAFTPDQLAVKLDMSADLLKTTLRRSLSELDKCLTS